MKTLPILFLLILLVACAPAVTESPVPTKTHVPTNTHVSTATATATLPPSPTPTESPEEVAARLAQDVLDGLVTFDELNAEQREAIYDQMTDLFLDKKSTWSELTNNLSSEESFDLSRLLTEKLNHKRPRELFIYAERSSGIGTPQNRVLVQVQRGSLELSTLNVEDKFIKQLPPLDNVEYYFVEDTKDAIPAAIPFQFHPLVEIEKDNEKKLIFEYHGKLFEIPVVEDEPSQINQIITIPSPK
jgi:hypothetical protein